MFNLISSCVGLRRSFNRLNTNRSESQVNKLFTEGMDLIERALVLEALSKIPSKDRESFAVTALRLTDGMNDFDRFCNKSTS